VEVNKNEEARLHDKIIECILSKYGLPTSCPLPLAALFVTNRHLRSFTLRLSLFLILVLGLKRCTLGNISQRIY